ncbi:nicotinamide-nucleotide adenylyltransferase [Candidatus Bathyarchaeota archaeon]|nr:nicotinamide-nucleotide adenylyltransferase [Candidatus Bathyarchaeota archaeon]
MKRGVFVGRFQPFHKGHLEFIKKILNEVEELIIIVGSSQVSHRIDNPFTAGERITMIRKALEAEKILLSRIWIIPVPDVHQHTLWVSQIMGYSPKFEVIYANEPLTRRLFQESGFKVEPMHFINREIFQATKIRNLMKFGGKWEKLVPKSVTNYIKTIKGDVRLRELNKTDN